MRPHHGHLGLSAGVHKVQTSNLADLLFESMWVSNLNCILSPNPIISLKSAISADYLTKVAVRNKSSKDMKVAEIMTERSKLMTVDPQQTTMDAMSLMIKNNFRHVPVVSFKLKSCTFQTANCAHWANGSPTRVEHTSLPRPSFTCLSHLVMAYTPNAQILLPRLWQDDCEAHYLCLQSSFPLCRLIKEAT